MILSDIRVATNLENMENLENSGNLKNCQNLRENSRKFEFLKKGKCKICSIIANKTVLQQIFLS